MAINVRGQTSENFFCRHTVGSSDIIGFHTWTFRDHKGVPNKKEGRHFLKVKRCNYFVVHPTVFKLLSCCKNDGVAQCKRSRFP